MTAKLVVSDAARADARDILDYLEEHAGEQIALRYAVDLDAAVDRIANFPRIGSPRRQLGDDVRVVIVDPFLLFYTVTLSGDDVVVLRVLHGSRDITRSVLWTKD
jgi:plasmid stabilization system protein ParE